VGRATIGADWWPVRVGTNSPILAPMPPCANWGRVTPLCVQHSSKLCCPHRQYICNNDNLQCILLEQQNPGPSASYTACPLIKPPPSVVQHCTPSHKEGHAHGNPDSCRG
jgi:hypothetical protein